MISKSDRFDRLQAENVYPLGAEALAPDICHLFNLDPELPVSAALARLPYISPDVIDRRSGGHEHYLQHQQVRVERIVGGNYNIFGSWLGNKHKETPEGVLTSLEHAQNLARDKVYNLNNYDPIWLKPFVDDDGDVWFRTDHGGHRIMAAKLNSEALLVANLIEPDKGASMDRYEGSVIKEALEARPMLSDTEQTVVVPRPWIGRISLLSLLRPTGTDGQEDRRRIRYLR